MKFSAPADRLKCVNPENKDLTVKRQSELLAVNRSSVYRKQHQDQDTDHGESLENLEIMNIINQESMKGGGVNANQYFLDHPSPHKRLAKFKSGEDKSD